MVRLKAHSFFSYRYVYVISIPYGAIKSYFVRLVGIGLLTISIPYGAIKRKFGITSRNNIN